MRPLSNQQRRNLVDTSQLYENHLDALRHAQAHAYGMRWKIIRSISYLFRERDRRGNGKLLGRRSPETEAILSQFLQGKQDANERLQRIRDKIKEQAALNKALRLNRVPRIVARILRQIDEAGLRNSFVVMGTQALFGYEAEAGVQFLQELLASGDVDLLYDQRKKLALASDKLEGAGLLGLLKRADRTFEIIRTRGFRAANAGEFMVDFIISPRSMKDSTPVTFGANDLVASEVPGLQWLMNCPKLVSIAADEDGFPVPFRVPDPRAFALHKAWLSGQPDREPIKKPRDLEQAKAMIEVIKKYLPQYPLGETLTSLHADIREKLEVLGVPKTEPETPVRRKSKLGR